MRETGFTPEVLAETELERTLNLREQYDREKRFLAEANLVFVSPQTNEVCVLDLDGIERPIPSYESIRTQLEAKREIYFEKARQGFTELRLTPFSLPIQELKERYGQLLKQKKAEGNLLSQTGEPLELDTNQPVYLWEEYEEKDDPAAGDNLVYNVTSFDRNHGGHTKRQILAEQTNRVDAWAGWEVDLQEANPVIPRAGSQEDPIGGRQRFETNQTPREYLQLLMDAQRAATDPEAMRQELRQQYGNDAQKIETELNRLLSYAHEAGDTIEGWLTRAMAELVRRNRVLDDWTSAETGALCYLLGSYHAAGSGVPYGYWFRDVRRADVGRSSPGGRDSSCGFRSRVRVEHP